MKLDYVDLCDVCDSGSATNFSFTHICMLQPVLCGL